MSRQANTVAAVIDPWHITLDNAVSVSAAPAVLLYSNTPGTGYSHNITIGPHNGANIFSARVLDRRYQGTQTAYGIELFGRRLEVVELGTAARHQVGVETQVSLPKESCWAYRDTGPVAFE